jgi:hypothetical protein
MIVQVIGYTDGSKRTKNPALASKPVAGFLPAGLSNVSANDLRLNGSLTVRRRRSVARRSNAYVERMATVRTIRRLAS